MAALKNKYEISLWEDLITDEYGYTPIQIKPLDWDTNYSHYYYFNDNDEPVAATSNWDESIAYYDRFPKFEEFKIGVIGSDTMTSESRAIEPCLTSNINGTNTFTFKMFYTYIDTQTGERVDNSWIQYLVNEARLKVKWNDKWYDFVIKNRAEDSGGKSVTFTCEDLFVNELSKTGFNLEFDTELENNQGTVFELAEKALIDTDWNLVQPSDESFPIIDGNTFAPDIIKQYTEEPVYLCVRTNTSTSATDYVLLFYSQVTNEVKENLQMVYYDGTDYFPTDTNSLLVTRNKVQRIVQPTVSWSGRTVTYSGYSISVPSVVSSDYRAERLVDSQKSLYDAKAQKYVSVYTDSQNNNKLTYGFSKTDYNSALMVTNVATWDATGPSGWETDDENVYWTIYPQFTQDVDVNTYKSEGYVRLKTTKTLYNTGVPAHRTFLPDGIQAGYEYIIRFRAMTGNNTTPTTNTTTKLNINNNTIRIQVKQSNNSYSDNYFSAPTLSLHTEQRASGETWYWQEFKFTCTKSIPQKELKNVRLKYYRGSEGATLWLTDFQFFQVLTYEDENNQEKIIYPGDFDAESRAIIRYYYYYPDDNVEATSIDNIEFLRVLENPDTTLKPILNDNNVKIRSITIKQSNRFNILQTLSETFQCWVKFGIVHDAETGKILFTENGTPRKYVTFVDSIGEDKGYGFVYGIDLKTIQRTVQSNQLVTKTIVQPNSNEFGENGFCTISRAQDNVPKTNFIINLDYYIANGMLNGNILAKDLYSTAVDDLGYYIRLQELNTKYDSWLDLERKLQNELLQQESLLDVYENLVSSTQDELNQVEHDLMTLASKDTITAALNYFKTKTNDQAKAWINDRSRLIGSLNNYKQVKSNLDKSINGEGQKKGLKDKVEEIEEKKKNYVKQVEDLDKAFNTKYARYLQEGSWISEDYMDDNLYYLDGLSVAYTASRPQVQYSINVLRLNGLEEFKDKIFNIGDIGFIEDKEFFGYEPDKITPIKEQIVVSQMATYFDSPERDTITIQNYKTQFEDLFQRITSATQSLQFARGEYAKAASVVNPDMTIKADLLESSLQQNLKIMTNATNESVSFGSDGLTIVNINNSNEQVKITSGGIIFTNDGGMNWTTGVDSHGMRANYIKTGVVNTNDIIVGPAASPSFRWDSDGLNAYAWDNDPSNINTSQFVRFDQYGLYGIKGNENFSSDGYYAPIDTTEIEHQPTIQYYELINGRYEPIPLGTKPQDWGHSIDNYVPWKGTQEEWEEKQDELYIYNSQTDSYTPNENPYDENITYYELRENPVIYYEENGRGLDTIKNYAQFGLTWDGFFIKNRYSNGYVEISSENDIQIVDGNNITRLKIGNLSDTSSPLYGLKIANEAGQAVLVTGSDGNLWLQNMLKVGNGTTSTVNIGYNPSNNTQDTHGSAHEVFEAGSGATKFVVYEDGYMVATGGTFTGEIYATGGEIGGLSIETIEETTYRVEINATNGTIFKNGDGQKTLTAKLYKGATEITSSISYQWYKNGSLIANANQATYGPITAPAAADVYSCACTYGT